MEKLRNWISDRFGLKQIKETTLDRRVAKGSWYYGDGATLGLLLMVLIATGAMMTLTYTPSPDGAYESVRYITEQQTLGWFIRGLHYWSAGMMVVMVFFHVMRQILVAGYKFPREGTWLIGVILFFAVIVMSFTGYVLRWDERAIHALRVAMHMFSRVPWIGDHLVVFIQGGLEPGATTLTRIFAVHVVFVPLLLMIGTAWHVYLVMVHGVTCKTERKQPVHTAEEQKRIYKEDAHSDERGECFYPETAAKSGAMAMAVFIFALILVLTVGPQVLGPPANLTERSFPAEEWWFWWYSALIALLPPSIAPWFVVVFPIALFVLMVLLPFVDRGKYRGIRNRPLAAAFVIITVGGVLYLSDLRRRSPWTGWPDPNLPRIPPGIELTVEALEGRVLYSQYGCNTCHAIADHGRRVGPDLGQIQDRLSRAEYREYILQPPEGVAMPAYQGRISDEHLERIIDFVHAAQTFTQ